MASVDIIIPNYNYARFLPACVESVLAQDVRPLRILIIDNASTDDSVAVAEALAAKHPEIALVCHEKNQGPHASFNEGIDLARADYMMILCSDDLLSAGALSRAVGALEANPTAVLAFGPETNTDEYRAERWPVAAATWQLVDNPAFLRRSFRTLGLGPGYGSMLVRTAVQQRTGHYRPRLPYTDDLEMLLRLSRHGPVAETNTPIGIRREHATNMSKTFLREHIHDLRERQAAFDSFLAEEPAATRGPLQRDADRCLAEAAFWSALSHAMRGRTAAARELYGFGFGLKPAAMLIPSLGYLVREKGKLKRVGEVAAEAVSARLPQWFPAAWRAAK